MAVAFLRDRRSFAIDSQIGIKASRYYHKLILVYFPLDRIANDRSVPFFAVELIASRVRLGSFLAGRRNFTSIRFVPTVLVPSLKMNDCNLETITQGLSGFPS